MSGTFGSNLTWEVLSQHLDEALDLKPDQRDHWLSELATTKPDLADTLSKMIAEFGSLEVEGLLAKSTLGSKNFLANRVIHTGKQVGAYRLERLLGRGGMGAVWLAVRNDGRFEGKCAIKFLDRSMAEAKVA